MNVNETITAIELNNLAVAFMVQANMEKAILSLTKALHASRQAFQAFDDDVTTSYEESSSSISLDECLRNSPLVNLAYNHDFIERPTHSNIYKRAINLPLTLVNDGSYLKVTVSILFNLGLAHQLLGIHHSKETVSEAALTKASRFYQIAYDLQEENPTSNVLFEMAVINNLGFLCQDLNEAIASRELFQRLLSHVLYVVDCGCGCLYESDRFFPSVSHLVFQYDCVAAAA